MIGGEINNVPFGIGAINASRKVYALALTSFDASVVPYAFFFNGTPVLGDAISVPKGSVLSVESDASVMSVGAYMKPIETLETVVITVPPEKR